MCKNRKLLIQSAYLYLALPFAIFSLTWMRLYIGIPAFIILCYGVYSSVSNSPELPTIKRDKKNTATFVYIVLISFFIVYLSGIGKFTFQNTDHYWRNAIQDALCRNNWPVYSKNPAGKTTSLIYYIGFWLPSAIVGKLLGESVGYVFMALWAAIGVLITYLLICTKMKKFRLWPFFLFLFFSGMDVAIMYFRGVDIFSLSSTANIEWATEYFQFSSFTTQLFWVFNQAIPAWIATLLIILQKNNKNIVFILSLAIINCTLPFVGMLPIAAYYVFTRNYGKDISRKVWWKRWFKDTFTVINVVCGGIIGILSFLYMISNSQAGASGGPIGFIWQHYGGYKVFFMNYLLFIVFELIIYLAIIYPYQKGNKLYYVIGISLIIIPLITVGEAADFGMRASIPPLMILFFCVADTLEKSYKEKRYKIFIPLLICLIIGARTPFNEITRSICNTSYGNISAGTFDIMNDDTQRNFIAQVDDSVFYKYIAKR